MFQTISACVSCGRDSRVSLFHRLGCTPSILGIDNEYRPACALALVVLSCPNWSGSWKIFAPQRKELYDLIDHDKNGYITLKDMLAFIKVEENVEKIRTYPQSVHGLVLPKLIEKTFRQFDKDKNGKLDKSEWDLMLDVAESYHLKYLHGSALVDYRAFFGRSKLWAVEHNLGVKKNGALKTKVDSYASIKGMLLRTGPGDGKRDCFLEEKSLQLFQMSFDWRSWGWLHDFYYYSANNHPLHSIFSCDPDHPLSWYERIVMEIAVFGLMFFSATKRVQWVTNNRPPSYAHWLHNPFLFRLCVATIPGMVFSRVLLFLFTSPCGRVDASNTIPKQMQRAKLINLFCSLIGYMLVITGWILGYFFWKTNVEGFVSEIVMARLQAYVISYGMYLGIYFNPIFTYGQPDPEEGYNLGDYIGFGQWRIEAAKYRTGCQRVLTAQALSYKHQY